MNSTDEHLPNIEIISGINGSNCTTESSAGDFTTIAPNLATNETSSPETTFEEAVRNIVFIFIVIVILSVRSCYSVYYQSKESSKTKIYFTSIELSEDECSVFTDEPPRRPNPESEF